MFALVVFNFLSEVTIQPRYQIGSHCRMTPWLFIRICVLDHFNKMWLPHFTKPHFGILGYIIVNVRVKSSIEHPKPRKAKKGRRSPEVAALLR